MKASAKMRPARLPETEGFLKHWLWTLPIILIVAELSLSQIDLYPATNDEFYSMINGGWVINQPYSPVDVLESLAQYSPNHTPLYFLLLNLWGHLVGYEVALGRVLTIFSSLLALAMLYRLARDNIAPAAGVFAVAILASNVFYNYFLAHARMYPLLVLTAAIVLWLYLHITRLKSRAGRRHYLAFGAACLALASTHAFSALLFITLAIYHLLFLPKNRRWFALPIAAAGALLIISPWIWILLSKGIGETFQFWEQGTASIWDVNEAWLIVNFNGSHILLFIALLSPVAAIFMGTIKPKPYLLLILIFVAALALTSHFSNSLSVNSMRLAFAGWPPLLLFLAAGLYGLYRWRKLSILLLLLWVASGLSFQRSVDLSPYLGWRLPTMRSAPWHRISSIVAHSGPDFPVYGIDLSDTIFRQRDRVNYSQYEHYFGRHNISVKSIKDFDAFQTELSARAITLPYFWVFYQTSKLNADERNALTEFLHEAQYQQCDATALGFDTMLMRFGWKTLDCLSIRLVATQATDVAAHEFYGHVVDLAAGKLTFVDKWTALADFDRENVLLSIQAVSDDWRNEAQVDLPMAHEGELRHFWIDISDLAPGSYRLMAILYDSRSGEKMPWKDNAGPAPTMQELTRIDIPER